MKPAIRQAEICDVIQRGGQASVDELAVRFKTSKETIRRDLTQLAESGKIRKLHGGARALPRQSEGPFAARMMRNAGAKRQIAQKIAGLVTPHQTLFLDTGSTTLICAEVLAGIKNLTIITNSTQIATTFAKGRGGGDVYLLGGAFGADNSQTGGDVAISQISTYRADMAIITVGAVDAGGVMDYSSVESEVARAMMQAAKQVVIVADHSKFNTHAPFHLCALNDITTLVTNRVLDSEMRLACAAADVAVI